MSIITELHTELNRFQNLFEHAKSNNAVIVAPTPEHAVATIDAYEVASIGLLTRLRNDVHKLLNEFESHFIKSAPVVAPVVAPAPILTSTPLPTPAQSTFSKIDALYENTIAHIAKIAPSAPIAVVEQVITDIKKVV